MSVRPSADRVAGNAVWRLAIAAAAATVAGCAGTAGGDADGRPVAASDALAATRDPARPRGCPVTVANGRTPPGVRPADGQHGNGRLWTVLWPNGVVRPERVERDGSINMKFPWWRGVRGRLRITGRRIDRAVRPLHAHVPSGYGRTGFQATAIHFTTAGCWRVVGRVGTARLVFVTRVVEP